MYFVCILNTRIHEYRNTRIHEYVMLEYNNTRIQYNELKCPVIYLIDSGNWKAGTHIAPASNKTSHLYITCAIQPGSFFNYVLNDRDSYF